MTEFFFDINPVKKSDFTVEIISVVSDTATYNDHCKNAVYKVSAVIYYKGNPIDSVVELCPYGEYDDRELAKNGEFPGLKPEWYVVKTQLDKWLARSLADGLTLNGIFGDLLLERYIDKVLSTVYGCSANHIPSNRMVWYFEKMYCTLCYEDSAIHLIIGPNKDLLSGLQLCSSMTKTIRDTNIQEVDPDLRFFVSNWNFGDK